MSWLQIESLIDPRLHLAAQHLVRTVRFGMFSVMSWSALLCSIYYALCSRAFRREQQAVVSGVLQQILRSSDHQILLALRRNIHRIEKGLLMVPQKPTFALEYIGETVDCYLRLNEDAAPFPDLEWAGDVLDLYFRRSGSHPIVDAARTKFGAGKRRGTGEKIPYKRGESEPPIPYDAFHRLAQRRKSVRWFLPQPVPHELIDKALEVAALAPSACNRQPFVYRFYDDPALLKEIAGLPHGVFGFAERIPVLSALVGDLSGYLFERDRHGIYVDASLSAMSFMYALETLGLASCPINWPDIEGLESRAEKLLGLKKHERIVMFIALGYPDPERLVAYSERKSIEILRRFNLCLLGAVSSLLCV